MNSTGLNEWQFSAWEENIDRGSNQEKYLPASGFSCRSGRPWWQRPWVQMLRRPWSHPAKISSQQINYKCTQGPVMRCVLQCFKNPCLGPRRWPAAWPGWEATKAGWWFCNISGVLTSFFKKHLLPSCLNYEKHSFVWTHNVCMIKKQKGGQLSKTN